MEPRIGSLSQWADKINNVLKEIEKKEQEIKLQQFQVGMNLQYAKQYCIQNRLDFIDFVKKQVYQKSMAQIYFYIKFYNYANNIKLYYLINSLLQH